MRLVGGGFVGIAEPRGPTGRGVLRAATTDQAPRPPRHQQPAEAHARRKPARRTAQEGGEQARQEGRNDVSAKRTEVVRGLIA